LFFSPCVLAVYAPCSCRPIPTSCAPWSDAIVGKLAAPSQGGLAAPDGGPALTLASRRSP
jgi:hypothetical protein